MKQNVAALSLLCALFILAGCGHDHDHPNDRHGEVGPHGGTLLVTDDANVLVEFIHEPQQQRIVLHIVDDRLQPVTEQLAPPVVNLIVNGTPEQLDTTAVPDQPGAYAATHPAFAGEDFQARANIQVGERVYQVELMHDHHHHHH